jgi:N-acetylglucosaminyldiphosphoundecaprenol N-acetyl-beta-D-mannosaminyltransferase
MHKAVICGFGVEVADPEVVVASLLESAARGEGSWLVTLNLEMISRAARDPSYRALLSHADLFVADGMPIVWASRLRRSGPPIGRRHTGVELVESLLVGANGLPVGVIGGARPQLALAKLNCGAAYVDDGVIDLGSEWLERTVASLRAQGVRLLFVALGVPKQDYLAAALRERIPEAIVIGVGGSFELIAGQKPRAPAWVQRSGLEWAFRLLVEPRRLWRRYLLQYPAGVAWLLSDTLPGRRG